MAEGKSTGIRKKIVAYRLRLSFKNGTIIKYTHVTRLVIVGDGISTDLRIHGETDDVDSSSRCNVEDTHKLRDISLMDVEFAQEEK